MEATNDIIRRVYGILQIKRLSVFETFVYFDVNTTNSLSKLELKLGLGNLDIYLKESDLSMIWSAFEKSKN